MPVTAEDYYNATGEHLTKYMPVFNEATLATIEEYDFSFTDFLDAPLPENFKKEKLEAIFETAKTICQDEEYIPGLNHVNFVFPILISKCG